MYLHLLLAVVTFVLMLQPPHSPSIDLVGGTLFGFNLAAAWFRYREDA